MTRPEWDDDIAALRRHVDERLKTQDEKLDELLAILRASKVGVSIIKGLAAIAASVIALWIAFKSGK